MGVPTSEVGYTPVMPRSENHEVHNGHVVAMGGGGTFQGKVVIYFYCLPNCSAHKQKVRKFNT